MHFKDDFVNILRDFGRLPYNSIRTSLQAVKDVQNENTELREKVKELETTVAVLEEEVKQPPPTSVAPTTKQGPQNPKIDYELAELKERD